MIKQITLLLLTVLKCSTIWTQIIFSVENSPYQPGISWEFTNWGGDGLFNFPVTGSENNWNFSDLEVSDGTTFQFGTLSIEGSPCEESYPPTTNRLFYEALEPDFTDTLFNYCTLNNAGWVINGSGCTPYLNAQTRMQYPFEIGDVFTDTFETNGGYQSTATFRYKAAGSLQLPMGYYYPEVALIFLEYENNLEFIFYAEISGKLFAVFSANFEGYYWVHALSTSLDVVSNTEEENIWKLKPTNENQFTVVGDSKLGYNINIYEISGRLVESRNSTFDIDLSAVQVGLYIIEVVADEKRSVFKVIIN